jgi:hypothetical protein
MMVGRRNARRIVDAKGKQIGAVDEDDNIKKDPKYYRNMCPGIN